MKLIQKDDFEGEISKIFDFRFNTHIFSLNQDQGSIFTAMGNKNML
jgi:hypothetical protein